MDWRRCVRRAFGREVDVTAEDGTVIGHAWMDKQGVCQTVIDDPRYTRGSFQIRQSISLSPKAKLVKVQLRIHRLDV